MDRGRIIVLKIVSRSSMPKLPRSLINTKEGSSQKTTPMLLYFIVYLSPGYLMRRRR